MSNETDEQAPERNPKSPAGDSGLPQVPKFRPKYLFFALVSAVVLIADVGSKAWAEVALNSASTARHSMVIVKDSLNFVLAYNQGGAWGLFHGATDAFRRPFFLLVSIAAVAFIISLYRKIHEGQWALKWGLPLVLGGALGNLTDRVTRIGVVDFIDYRADWVLAMNQLIAKLSNGWTVTDHWPTFNVADIAICVGVVFMALDVLFSKRHSSHKRSSLTPAAAPPGPIG
jgi:signal peptidase II